MGYRSTASWVFLLIVSIGWTLPGTIQAGVDEGVTSFVPWSGSYWPIGEGALIRGPLSKYDRITGRQAARWEAQQNPPAADVPEWFGYCHAWAAAAVLDHEPARPQIARALDGAPLKLGIADQKGLLTACHTDDVAQHYGVRFDGQPGDDLQDIYPDQLWRVLKLYIQQRGIPIIVDLECGPQVWNYPVYAYRVVYRPMGQGDTYFGEMTLWMADDAVPPDILGVQINKQTFYFTFALREGAAQLGTGRWVEPSVNNHPDFAWFPYVVRAENPEVDYQQVRGLLRFPATGSTPDTLPPDISTPAVPSSPGTSPAGGENTIPLDDRAVDPAVLRVPPNTVPILPTQPIDDAHGSGSATSRPTPGNSRISEPCLLSSMELLNLVLNQTSNFTLDVTVDKFDGGHYESGEPLTVRGTSAHPGYLYLFYLDDQAALQLLFPRGSQVNGVQADVAFHLPPRETQQTYHAGTGPGVHRIKAVVTTRRLQFSGLVSPAESAEIARAGAANSFVLPPSQETMYRRQLSAYLQGKNSLRKALAPASCRKLLGDFAQDEVAFYVRAPLNPVEPARR